MLDLRRMGAERLARLREQMQAQGVDGAVLLHGPNVCYATGYVPAAVDASHANHQRAVAIVSASDGPARLHSHDPATEAAAGSEMGTPLWPELDDGAAALESAIAEVLGDVAGLRVAVDAMTGAMVRAGVLDGAELVDASRVLGPARLVKTEDELACLDQAQRWTERAMVAAREACVPGATRAEVAGAFLAALRDDDIGDGDGGGAGPAYRNGIDPIFQPMPLHREGGPRTSTGHVAFPTGVDNPVFGGGDLLWVDAGVGLHGYMSDFGCTWVPGRAPTAAEQSLCDRWMAVLEASLAVVGPGATLGDVGRAARSVERHETPWLPQFYLAHGAGLESAEMPMIGTDLGQAFDHSFELVAGMVLVFEPVIWVDGTGGYRAEEVVAVTDDGWRRLGGGDHYEPFRT